MKLEEAKVGIYICKIGNPNYMQKINKVNLKSISCGYSLIKENELKDYIIVDEEVAKARTIKGVFNKECGELKSINYLLTDLARTIEEYKDYLLINSDKLNKEIEETIANVNKAINEVLNNE